MPATRILGRRWAYRDKNYSRRRIDTNVAWRHKSHLVVFGHQDPDIGKVLTDAPTINRISILILLQFVAARQGGDDPCLGSCQASAGDVTAAFLNGRPIFRQLYTRQPRTGVAGLEAGALFRLGRGIFGLVGSPRSWWLELKNILLELKVVHEGWAMFKQHVLDPCVFMLVSSRAPDTPPKA